MTANEDTQPGGSEPEDTSNVTKWTSVTVLVISVLLAAIVLFRVLQPFLFPMLFSAVLTVLFRPLHLWLTRFFRGRTRLAAATTTVAVFVGITLPLVATLFLAGIELLEIGGEVGSPSSKGGQTRTADRQRGLLEIPRLITDSWLSEEQADELNRRASAVLDNLTTAVYSRTQAVVADVVTFTVGLIVMTLGFYYLLADGEKVRLEATRLLPLEAEDQRVLLARFDNVCRGVVVGTVAAALAQGVLAGIGFAAVGAEKIWILAVLTVFFAFIPFLGAAMIWIPVVVSLLLEERYIAASVLSVYGTVVISTADNVIKAKLIGDRTQIHPFVVLVSVLGAIRFAGLWGIFVGPVTVAFLYALLIMLQQKLYPQSDTPEAEAITTPTPQAIREATDVKPDRQD